MSLRQCWKRRLSLLIPGILAVLLWLLPSQPLEAFASPWTRRAAPDREKSLPTNAREAAHLGAARAAEVVDAALISALYSDQQCFGLSLLQGAVGDIAIHNMRNEACRLWQNGRLTPSGDPNEPQLSEQYKKYIGDLPTLTILQARQAEAEGLSGLAYGSGFLCGLCKRISSSRPEGEEALEPGTIQLACYNGGGVSYQRHQDYVPQEDYDPADLPEHHRLSFRRRVTAILYLQEEWREEWGGAFRAHTGGSIDVQPEGGSLLLFRADMPHEVLPTFEQRFALSMWCHASDPER